MSIEYVILETKQQVIQNRQKNQYYFSNVEAVADWQASAGHWEDTAYEVSDDASDWPPSSAFSFEVVIGLRGALEHHDG